VQDRHQGAPLRRFFIFPLERGQSWGAAIPGADEVPEQATVQHSFSTPLKGDGGRPCFAVVGLLLLASDAARYPQWEPPAPSPLALCAFVRRGPFFPRSRPSLPPQSPVSPFSLRLPLFLPPGRASLRFLGLPCILPARPLFLFFVVLSCRGNLLGQARSVALRNLITLLILTFHRLFQPFFLPSRPLPHPALTCQRPRPDLPEPFQQTTPLAIIEL
jgi:hypothetical protein